MRNPPPTIHRYWHGPNPPPWVDTVAAMCPTATVTDWTDDTLPPGWVDWLDRMADQVAPPYQLRHRSNLVRMRLLHERGGIWLDHDVIPLEDITGETRPWVAAHRSSVCTCAISLPAGHRSTFDLLRRADTAPHDGTARSMDVAGEHAYKPGVDVLRRQLPFDSLGRPIPDSRPWVVHLFASKART